MSNFKGISIWEVPDREAIYTFVDDDKGHATHIAATTLREAVERAGIIPQLVMMGESLIEAITGGSLNVEEDHALKLPDEALDTPILVGNWGHKHIIIDGSHRLWRRWKRGDPDFPAYVIPEKAWRRFVIYDMPGDGNFWERFNRTAKVR